MRKTVLTFGLIAGVIMSAVMLLVTIPFHDRIGSGTGMIIGYTSMVIAFLLVFFGVRSYRDNVAGGSVGFFRALGVGAMIAAVASLCYVATWEVVYFTFTPDFLGEYQEQTLERMRAEGESAEAIALKRAEMAEFAEMYDNPAFNAAVTFLEPLPVALIMSLVSAGVLSRRRKEREEEGGVMLGAGASA